MKLPEFSGSTHAERVKALSDLLQSINPQKDRARFDATFDAYLCVVYVGQMMGEYDQLSASRDAHGQ